MGRGGKWGGEAHVGVRGRGREGEGRDEREKVGGMKGRREREGRKGRCFSL